MGTELKKCLSCTSLMSGKFCSSCGEKVVQDSDFSLSKILGEGFTAFTNLDNKLYRSVWALMFKPGFLSQEYIEGRRNKYMKPFQLYILCSLLLFVFLADFDIVLIPSQWFFVEKYGDINWGVQVMDLARNKMQALGISLDELKALYDTKVVNYSKIGIIIMVPLLAGFSYFIGRKRMPQCGKHFVVSMHNFCFILLLMTLMISILRIIKVNGGSYLKFGIFFLLVVYLIIAFRRLLKLSNLKSLFYGISNFIFIFIVMFFYRVYICFFTLWML